MATQHTQYITLDECITGYLNESEQSNHKYFKLWHLAFRGLTELGLDMFYQVKSVKLPIQSNKTVTIPSDYLQYTKIGVLNARGEVVTLGYNNKLTTFADLLPDRKAKTQDNNLYYFYDPLSSCYYNYWGGYGYTNLYGVPSGQPNLGSFKIDINNGIILLNEDFAFDYLIVEYVASPVEGEDYYIPIQFKEALIAYLAWKDIKSIPSKTHVNNANVGMRRADFYNERRLAIARYKPFHLMEAYEQNLQMQRMAIKA